MCPATPQKMLRNGLKIDLDSKFPQNLCGICPTKTIHGGLTIDELGYDPLGKDTGLLVLFFGVL